MQAKLVYISTSTFAKYSQESILALRMAGYNVELNHLGRHLTETEIGQILHEKPIIGLIAGTEPLTEKVLKNSASLKVISRCGTGLDNVDLNAAEKFGMKVYNTPDAPTDAVAELTLGLILDCIRNISNADRSIRNGKWNKPMGELLGAKTVGIVGYGRIGKAVARLVRAFGSKVLAYDIEPKEIKKGVHFVSLEKLLSEADVVTLHLPYNPAKGKLITKDNIAMMKNGAYLINTSRGELVDENALYAVLKSGKLAGAGLDVFEREPYNGPLTELDNLVLTPHIGSYARQARIKMEGKAVENLLKGLKEIMRS
jgi:D-3-phosphoglycerate dehydrogenase